MPAPNYNQKKLLEQALTSVGGASTVEAQDPLSLDPSSKISMSPVEWMSTFDPEFKRRYPAYAALNAYHHPFQDTRDPFFVMGRGIRKVFDKGYPGVSNILDKGPLAGGLLSAIPGAALGFLGTGLINLATGDKLTNNIGRNTLLGALATIPLGAYSGYLRKYKPYSQAPSLAEQYSDFYNPPNTNELRADERAQALNLLAGLKSASVKSAFSDKSSIISAIQNSPGLSFAEKSQLIAGISQLSTFDQNQLADLISQVSGAAVGALVAKYLLNRGVLGSVLGAIFGGTVAKAVFGSSPKTNYLGQPVLNLPSASPLPINTSAIYSSISL